MNVSISLFFQCFLIQYEVHSWLALFVGCQWFGIPHPQCQVILAFLRSTKSVYVELHAKFIRRQVPAVGMLWPKSIQRHVIDGSEHLLSTRQRKGPPLIEDGLRCHCALHSYQKGPSEEIIMIACSDEFSTQGIMFIVLCRQHELLGRWAGNAFCLQGGEHPVYHMSQVVLGLQLARLQLLFQVIHILRAFLELILAHRLRLATITSEVSDDVLLSLEN